jgi:hypothetical protein
MAAEEKKNITANRHTVQRFRAFISPTRAVTAVTGSDPFRQVYQQLSPGSDVLKEQFGASKL